VVCRGALCRVVLPCIRVRPHFFARLARHAAATTRDKVRRWWRRLSAASLVPPSPTPTRPRVPAGLCLCRGTAPVDADPPASVAPEDQEQEDAARRRRRAHLCRVRCPRPPHGPGAAALPHVLRRPSRRIYAPTGLTPPVPQSGPQIYTSTSPASASCGVSRDFYPLVRPLGATPTLLFLLSVNSTTDDKQTLAL
jgi:hypothetical protein